MTRAKDEAPTRRLMTSLDGEDYVIELAARYLRLRPKGTRRGGPAEVSVTPGQLYVRLMVVRADERRRERKRKRRGRR